MLFILPIICSRKTTTSLFSRRLSRLLLVPVNRMGDTPMDIKSWRAPYLNHSEPFLIESQLPSRDPFKLFDIWFRDVASQRHLSYEEVNAVNVATVGKDLRPSSRMVLMKAYNDQGFSFYSNKDSRKGRQLEENPHAAMSFFWPFVSRQVRVEGSVHRLPPCEADSYWNSRPLASRIGSKSSQQSSRIPDREFLMLKKRELELLANEKGPDAITKPESWIGFQLIPDYFEFWQGQSDRLHDRIVFSKRDDEACEHSTDVGNGWKMFRLSP